MRIHFLDPNVFVSKLTLKKLEFHQKHGNIKYRGVAPQISKNLAENIDSSTKGGSLFVTYLSSGNFITSLILGGSMQ